MDTKANPLEKLLTVNQKLVEPARMVADELGETSKNARRKLNRAIQVVGMAKVVALVGEARKHHGTMMVRDGSRPRTLGGCFFELLFRELGADMDRIQKPIKPKPVG